MSKGGGERTFFHYAGANDNLSYRNLKLSNIKNYKPKIFYVGYLTFLGKLDELDNNNKTKLCSVLKKTKKMGMLNCLDLASYDHKNYKKIIKSAANIVTISS